MKNKQHPPIQDPLAPSVAPHSSARQRIHYTNNTFGATGTRVIKHDEIDGTTFTTFGFSDLKVWHPKQQRHIPLPDKFYVNGYTYQEASSEFWARWKIYIGKRFNLDYLRIEFTSTITD
jgi:hypothetical protein